MQVEENRQAEPNRIYRVELSKPRLKLLNWYLVKNDSKCTQIGDAFWLILYTTITEAEEKKITFNRMQSWLRINIIQHAQIFFCLLLFFSCVFVVSVTVYSQNTNKTNHFDLPVTDVNFKMVFVIQFYAQCRCVNDFNCFTAQTFFVSMISNAWNFGWWPPRFGKAHSFFRYDNYLPPSFGRQLPQVLSASYRFHLLIEWICVDIPKVEQNGMK